MWYDSHPLGNQYWTSGAANGTATLYNTNQNGSSTTFATTSFSAGAQGRAEEPRHARERPRHIAGPFS
jgi:hypothetical protein